MYHFDFPLEAMKKTRGWAFEEVVPLFRDYADFLFKTFGDRVSDARRGAQASL